MPAYSYKALAEDGTLVEGKREAATASEVVEYLEREGFLPLSVKEEKIKRRVRLPVFRRRVSKKDIIVFTQSLGILLRSGVPIDKALGICLEISEGKPVAKVIEDIRNEIRRGASLSEALSKYPGLFSRLYINTVKAGEVSGVLPEVLERIHAHMVKMEEFKSSVINSLIYPSFLVLVGLLSIFVLVTFVVPRFYTIFESSGVTPPFPIPQLAAVGAFVSGYGLYVFLSFAVLFLCFYIWYTRGGADVLHRKLLSLPGLGSFLLKVENVKFSGNLGTLLVNGVPILQAVLVVKEMFGNPVMREEMDRIYRYIREGKKLTSVLEARKDIWHPMLVGMCSVGEETGELGEMLVKASGVLEEEIRGALDRFVALIEPATVLSMGLVVGAIVVSMISAIFSINDIVR